MNRYAACLVALLLTPIPAAAESYRMRVNHGVGWTPIDDSPPSMSANWKRGFMSAQAGCAAVSALQQQDAARECAARSRAEVIVKPGEKLTTFGTERQQFEFQKCMAGKGQPVEAQQA